MGKPTISITMFNSYVSHYQLLIASTHGLHHLLPAVTHQDLRSPDRGYPHRLPARLLRQKMGKRRFWHKGFWETSYRDHISKIPWRTNTWRPIMCKTVKPNRLHYQRHATKRCLSERPSFASHQGLLWPQCTWWLGWTETCKHPALMSKPAT